MQKDLTYRFVIAYEKGSGNVPIMQLFDRNQLLGSTYDLKSNNNTGYFEHICLRTGNYQIYITSKEAREGCAIGLMAMVTDSAYYAQGNKKPVNDKYVLYAGIEHQLNIITDQPEFKKVEIVPERGHVYRKDSLWFALIPDAGPVKISVRLYNNSDSVIEKIDQQFDVIPLPKPEIKIEGVEGDYINTTTMGPLVKLIISPSVYKLNEFYISTDLSYNSGLRGFTEYLTNEMVDFIKALPNQQKLYIKDIQVTAPDGSVITINSVTYYIK
jgi:hypothetical protein